MRKTVFEERLFPPFWSAYSTKNTWLKIELFTWVEDWCFGITPKDKKPEEDLLESFFVFRSGGSHRLRGWEKNKTNRRKKKTKQSLARNLVPKDFLQGIVFVFFLVFLFEFFGFNSDTFIGYVAERIPKKTRKKTKRQSLATISTARALCEQRTGMEITWAHGVLFRFVIQTHNIYRIVANGQMRRYAMYIWFSFVSHCPPCALPSWVCSLEVFPTCLLPAGSKKSSPAMLPSFGTVRVVRVFARYQHVDGSTYEGEWIADRQQGDPRVCQSPLVHGSTCSTEWNVTFQPEHLAFKVYSVKLETWDLWCDIWNSKTLSCVCNACAVLTIRFVSSESFSHISCCVLRNNPWVRNSNMRQVIRFWKTD